MRHRPDWGALLAGLVLLTVAGVFAADLVAGVDVPLQPLIPLLLIGLGCAAVLRRRSGRNE